MAQVRAPGIYYEPGEQRIPPLELGRTGVPVFLGITRRGPLDVPVRVTGEDRFAEIFGEPVPQSFLTTCLKGFFANGGEECFVLRVARLEGEPGEDVARRAAVTLLDRAGQPAIAIAAQDEGAWGNDLRVSIRETPDSPRTFLTRDAEFGATAIQVKATLGLTPGTLLHILDGRNEQWVEVAGVEGKSIQLAEPLRHAFASAAPTYVQPRTLDLVVRDHDRSERFERLSMSGASPRFIERTLNDQSRLVRASALRPDTPPALRLLADQPDTKLTGGSDGIADLGPDDFIGHDRGPGDRRGLLGLVEFPEIDLVAMPDLMAAYMHHSKRFRTLRDVEVVQEAAITLCERSSNRFAILDLPPGGDFEEALRWRQQFDSAHAAFYYPWVVVLDGAQRRKVPPSAHVAGIFARSDREYGVHKAPANEVVQSVVDLEVLLQDDHLAMLNQAGINCLRPFGPRGLRVWGARSASSDPEWRYINVRRTISAIAATIERGTQWAVFEPNSPGLWKRVTRIIVGFLMGLRERGMLAGNRPEDAFFVKCDHETNPPEDVDRGILVTEIGLAVVRPVEFIVFRLSQRLENEAQQEEV
jgi:hypothetical protein